MSEIFPGQHEANRRMDEFLDSLGIGSYSPGEIRVMRAHLAMTERAFAKALGVSRIAVQRWESGERAISDANAERLDRLMAHVEGLERSAIDAIRGAAIADQTFIIYRDDEHLREHHPDSPLTADTILAIAGRVYAATGCAVVVAS